ncbi:MAG TPA: glycoside hydrolase [Puia sp.]
MKTIGYLLLSALLVPVTMLVGECKKSGQALPPPDDGQSCFYNGVDTCNQKPAKLTLTVDLSKMQQTIHSFGASDGWTCKFIGKWADVSKKNKIADLLFSMDTLPDGSPKGIGLSLWRMNIGAGSFEQGDTSQITTDWRREECFRNADGSYDWSKEAGGQWFLQAARQRGVKYSLGFALSPPVFMTKNHRAFNGSGTTSLNIQDGRLGDYADFLTQVAAHFQFDYISPVNEPQWAWGTATGAGQEGSQAQNSEISDLVKLLSAGMASKAPASKVVVGEAGQWDFLYGKNTDGRGDQINQWFNPSSSYYIGNLPNVQHAISAHSYYTTCPDDNLVNIRQQVASKMKQVDPTLEAWQTEFGILGNICSLYNGSPRTTSIDYGLYVAKTIHHDLTIANVTTWQWWLAVSPYDYSDGLVYINDASGKINVDNCKQDGIVLDSKQLWSLGNYARFVRPGMKRISAIVQGLENPVTAAGSLMVSAYKDETTKKLVIVAVNVSSQQTTLQLSGVSGVTKLDEYVTDANNSLKRSQTAPGSITVAPKAIVTLTGTYQ